MNCHDAQTWILRSEVPALPPLPLVEHLRQCGRCRQVHEQLLLIERQLQSAPLPGIPVPAKTALMNGLAPAPQAVVQPKSQPTIVTRRRRRRMPAEHLVGYAMATAASIAVGVVLGYALAGRNQAPVAVAPPVPAPAPEQVAEVVKPMVPEKAPLPPETAPLAPEFKPAETPLVAVTPSNLIGQAATAVPNQSDVTSPEVVPMPAAQERSPLEKARFLTDDELLAQLVENHTQVSAAFLPQDRLARLAALSDLVWAQAIKEAQSGNSSNGEWLKQSYAAIVEIDLPAIARELPEDQKQAAATLAVTLEGRAAEVGRLLPDVTGSTADVFGQLQKTAQSGAKKVLKKTRDPATLRPQFSGGSSTLLPLAVEQTIAVAREDNPLERADHSAVLAEGLAKDILVTALRGDEDRAALRGNHFGRVLQEAISGNLQKIDPEKATYQQTRRYQQVVARTQQTIIFLQQSLEAAPPAARGGIAKAMEQGGLAQLVPPPGPSRRGWVWNPKIIIHFHRGN